MGPHVDYPSAGPTSYTEKSPCIVLWTSKDSFIARCWNPGLEDSEGVGVTSAERISVWHLQNWSYVRYGITALDAWFVKSKCWCSSVKQVNSFFKLTFKLFESWTPADLYSFTLLGAFSGLLSVEHSLPSKKCTFVSTCEDCVDQECSELKIDKASNSPLTSLSLFEETAWFILPLSTNYSRCSRQKMAMRDLWENVPYFCQVVPANKMV